MIPQTSAQSLEDTAISRDPVRPAPPAAADGRALGLADTAVSAAGSILSGPTMASGRPPAGVTEIPARVGRFMVIRTLGAGGMGVVLEAYDPELDRRVAVKLLRAGRLHNDSQARLIREAQAMARLSHPNVVQIYDVGVAEGQVFLAMEMIRGRTLTSWLEGQKRSWREIQRVFVDAARGLAAAHAAGLVHRDFKPDNVLIADDGRVRVADFGLAREDRLAIAEGDVNPGTRGILADTLTVTGVVMGTPVYMSPEQHRGEPAGPGTDIFSFSVALFEALHGVRPFAGETMPELARNVVRGEVVAVPAGRDAPAWIDAVVRRGLAVRVEERFPSFEALLVALDRDPAATRRRWLGAGGLALGAALAGFGAQAARGGEVCTAGDAAIEALWSEEARAGLEGLLGGRAGAARALAGLDAYAAGWAARRRGACLANQSGDRSDMLMEAEVRCLEVRREALAGAIAAIGEGGALAEAATIVAGLPPLAACDDAEALLAEVPPPADAAAAAAVEAERHRLARARVAFDAGRAAEALEVAADVEGRGEALGYRPLVAEAALARGRFALEGGQPPAAEEAFARAHVAATAVRADAIAAEAEARRIYTVGVAFGRGDEALAAGPRAEALVERLGGRGDLRALLRNSLGGVRLARGEEAAARRLFDEALALAEDDPRVSRIDLATGYLNNAALAAEGPAERDRRFGEARGILVDLLGAEHGSTLWLDATWAMYTADPRAARDRLAPACAGLMTQAEVGYLRCGECFITLGHVEDELGDEGAAAAAMRAAEGCFAGPVDAGDRELVDAQRSLARGYERIFAGDPEGALGPLASSEAVWRSAEGAWWAAPSLADVLVGRGRALVARDRGAEAAPALDEAVGLLEGHLGRDKRALPRLVLEQGRRARATIGGGAEEAVPGGR